MRSATCAPLRVLAVLVAGLGGVHTPGVPPGSAAPWVPNRGWCAGPAASADDAALRARFRGHEDEVKAIAFVPHQNRVLTQGCDLTLRAWDADTGAERYRIALNPPCKRFYPISPHLRYDSPLAVSPDGRLAAVSPEATGPPVGVIQVYDTATGKKVHEIQRSEELFYRPYSLSFSTRGDRLAVALAGKGALEWSLADNKPVTPLDSDAVDTRPKSRTSARIIAHLRGDGVLAAARDEHTLEFFDAATGRRLDQFVTWPQVIGQGFIYDIYHLALSGDSGLLLVGVRPVGTNFPIREAIHVWDMTTGEKAWAFRHPKHHVTQAAFSPDGRYVAVGFYDDPKVHLYRVGDGKEMAAFTGHTKGVTCLAFSQDGKRIATGSLDKTAIVWDVPDDLLAPAPRPRDEKESAKCWDTLRGGKPLEANEAVSSLAAAGDDAVAYLEGKLRPAQKPDADRVKKLLAQLDDDKPEKRDDAARELSALGTQIEGDAKKALEAKPSAEAKRRLEELLKDMRPWVKDPDTVRAVRAVYVLERVGSERAVKLLKKLAEGDPAARLTREAKISLERIEVRKPPKT